MREMPRGMAMLTAADLTGCRALAAMTHASLSAVFRDALARAGATIVNEVAHEYPGQGLTCVLVLEESHAVLHTWPELGTAHVDVFSCTGRLDARAAVADIAAALQAGEVAVTDLPRSLSASTAPLFPAPAPVQTGVVMPAPSRGEGSGRATPAAVPPSPPAPSTLSPLGFVARALGASVALFGVQRLAWVEQHVLWPFTAAQAHAAQWAGGGPDTLARVGLACSGADAIALVAGAVAVWPAPWRARLRGIVIGTLLIVAVNIVRITSLVRITDLDRFNLMHETVWPAILALTALAFVATWMWRATDPASGEPPRSGSAGPGASGPVTPAVPARTPRLIWSPFARTVTAAVVATVAFFAAAPWYLHSAAVAALAEWMAGAGASVLHAFGATARTQGPVLITARGAFMVTSECIMTPVLPIGVAAALTVPRTWAMRTLAVLAMGPLFVGLGVARLLVLALPEAIAASPVLWIHAFFQVLLAMVVIAAAAAWRARRVGVEWMHVWARAGLAMACGAAVAIVIGPGYAEAVERTAGTSLHALDDQGAFAFMPAFQLGLLVALVVAVAARWRARQWAVALGAMILLQVAVVALAGVWLPDAAWPVPGVRAWAVVLPLLLVAAPRLGAIRSSDGYQAFWETVGDEFPDLGGAASTDLYRANEERLFREYLSPLDGRRVLKTDLWDEARNTRILQWAGARGARVYGIDISLPTARRARSEFGDQPVGATGADVRQLPFGDATFDAIYSMGTIEHFDDFDRAVAEMARVLRPGGRAIVGVPNRLDPFLRPALVWVMQRVGLYDYGAERSFTRGQLRRLLQAHGLEVVAEDAILFIPGWLRMLDLACYAWWPALAPVTRALVASFAWLDRHVPRLRRHGYLLATVVEKPRATTGPRA